LFLLKEKRTTPVIRERGGFFSFFSYWKIAGIDYRRLVAGLLIFALFNSSDVFLLLRTRELTGSDQITILAYVFYNLVFAVASYPLGILADKWGTRKVFIFGLMFFVLVYAGFAFVNKPWMVFGLFFFYGLYAAATEGIAKAWITNLAHETRTATAVGFFTSCQSICTLLASIVAGLLWAGFGPVVVFSLSAAITLALVLYFVLYVRNEVYQT
ncbi:MAG TPA: MFS transporter, partial [Cyclobacteriaceae bacterium]|nr:MFS transporter [Cyclobacteriaceae bacterium]